MKTLLFTTITALVLGLAACKKEADSVTPGQPGNAHRGTVETVGRSLGAGVKKQIGPEGGSLQSADGSVRITVPAGALTALTEVGIEPITNTCNGGIGNGWRLTPHGKAFAKPVQLTLDYTAVKDSVTFANALGLAYQDSNGIWQFIGATAINANAHTLTMQTNHFSDWTLLQWLTLWPIHETLHEGGQVTLEAREYIAVPDGLNVPLVPDYENGYPVGDPEYIAQKYVKKWSLAGVGALNPLSTAPEAVYLAPVKVTKTQTVAVSLELNLPGSGQAFLVSSIDILGKEPFVDYLQVAEKKGPNGRDSELIIYGANFGAQDNAKSSVTINGEVIGREDIGLWGDNIIICRIPMLGNAASGEVRVNTASGVASQPHMLNEWTVAMRYRRPCARVGQSLFEASTIYLRIRGDASPPPQNLNLLMGDNNPNTVAFKSYVNWQAGGDGLSSYNNEESCGAEKEIWSKSEGDIELTPDGRITDPQYFRVALYHLPGRGFDAVIEYEAKNVVPSNFVFTPCKGNPVLNNRPYTVHLPTEFHEERFRLLFNGNGLKGGKSAVHPVGIGSYNLHCDVSDVPNWMQQVSVEWDNTAGKY
jgi:hypothetical protein